MITTDFKGICEFFENAESTVKQKFGRKQEQYRQIGIIVEKSGRGKAASYSVDLDLNIIKNLTNLEYPNAIETLEDIKKLKAWVQENSEYCYMCKKWISKNSSHRIAVPSASGMSEILCYCCNDCYEDGYHTYSV